MNFSEQFEALHQMASESAGLDDFGSPEYQAPLRLLLSDLDQYANYNEAGI